MGIVFNCFPIRYEDQYYLNWGTVPDQLDLSRNKLTQIEQVIDNAQKHGTMSTSNKDKEKAASSQKRAPTKQNGKTKKKPKVTVIRYCQLCAEHDGAEWTHNTKSIYCIRN